MNFKEQIKKLADRILKYKKDKNNEAETQHVCIMRMLDILEYGKENPFEIALNYVTDVKKSEKVDVAIMRDEKPFILIECKLLEKKLNKDDVLQLRRYFCSVYPEVVILTNGFKYRFYLASDKENVMDNEPFLEIDITDEKADVEKLKYFSKSKYNYAEIKKMAKELKREALIKKIIQDEVLAPHDWFVKALVNRIYEGKRKVGPNELTQFTPPTEKVLLQVIADKVEKKYGEKLKDAQNSKTSTTAKNQEAADKLEWFFTIRGALGGRKININQVIQGGKPGELSVLFKGNDKQPICRLEFKDNKKFLYVYDESVSKRRISHDVEKIDDVFQYIDVMVKRLKHYEGKSAKRRKAPAS